jgi:hypothetical protein
LTLLTLVLLVPASVSAQSNVSVYVTGPDLLTKELEIKVVEGQKAKSSFQVKPESVVQVTQGGNLLVVTEPRNNVDNVKITDGGGKITELVNTNDDTFSLSGIAPGVYTLDVIANLPNSDDRAAYETILVVLQRGQSPLQPVEVINQVKVITEVTFEGVEDDDECSNEPGSAGMKFPMDKRTECEKRDYDECEKKGFGSSNFCENMDELFEDNDCFGFSNSKECDTWYNDGREKFCEKYPNHKSCENSYIDEGDYLTCDHGFVDKGKGCEPVDCETNPGNPDCNWQDIPADVTEVPILPDDEQNVEKDGGESETIDPEENPIEEEEIEEEVEEEEESSEEESSEESDGTDSGVN